MVHSAIDFDLTCFYMYCEYATDDGTEFKSRRMFREEVESARDDLFGKPEAG